MRRKAKIIVYTEIFVLVFLATALARVYLLGSAPERLVKSLGQDLTGTVFRDQIYENENGNRYDLYIPAELDRMQDQNLILYIHGGSFNSGSKADGETWCRYYAAQGYITASVDYTLQMHGKDVSIYQMNKEIENAVRAIRQRTEELGYHIAGMAPFGVSAGGTLAMNLAYSGNSAIPVRFVFQVAAPTYFEPSEWPLLMKVDKLTSAHDFCRMMTGKEVEDYTQEIRKISPAGIVKDDSVPSLIAYGRIDHCVPVNQKYYLMGAYILHNVPYDYIEFPKSNHGMYNDPDKLQEFLEKSLEYAERYFTD